MAEYNPRFYLESGIKMHPVGVMTKQEMAKQKTQASKPVVTYMEKPRLERVNANHKTKAGLYGAAQFKLLKLEDITNYAPNTGRRLKSGGLREGQLNLEQMQQLFEKIPPAERSGVSFEDALKNIENYLSDKHFSHGKAHGSGNADNIHFENARDIAIELAYILIPVVAPAPVADIARKVAFAKKFVDIVYKNRRTFAKFFNKNYSGI